MSCLKKKIAFASILTISVLFFTILGFKTRVGYLSNFDFVETFGQCYIYKTKINYYSKIFRSSDIYGVYPKKNNFPRYITNIQFDNGGSRFGRITSTQKLSDSHKIDINYTLKIKPKIWLAYILLLGFIHIYFSRIKPMLQLIRDFRNLTKSKIVISIFLLSLILPQFISFILGDRIDTENYENRVLFDKPKMVLKDISNYPSQYENYINDHIAFKNQFVMLKNLIDIKIFKYIISRKILLGKDNHIFSLDNITTGDYVGALSYSDLELIELKSNFIKIRDVYKSMNIDFVIFFAPLQSKVYSSNMPSYINLKTDTSRSQRLIAYLQKNTDLKIVYPLEELISAKDKYRVYYKYDPHWNSIGAFIGSQQLFDILKIKRVALSDLEIAAEEEPTSFFFLRATRLLKYLNDDKEFVIKNYPLKQAKLISDKKADIVRYRYYESDSDNKQHIMMIHDSFTTAMEEIIASEFAKSTFVFANYFNATLIEEEKPDLIVFETVEYADYRFNSSYLSRFIDGLSKSTN